MDEVLWRQLQAASKSQEVVFVGDFNYPDMCWRSYTAKHTQSRSFLETLDHNFLSQAVEVSSRNSVLELILTNREGLVGDMKVGGSLGCGDHVILEFSVEEEAGQKVSLKPWTSGELTLVSLWMFLGEYHASRPCRKE